MVFRAGPLRRAGRWVGAPCGRPVVQEGAFGSALRRLWSVRPAAFGAWRAPQAAGAQFVRAAGLRARLRLRRVLFRVVVLVSHFVVHSIVPISNFGFGAPALLASALGAGRQKLSTIRCPPVGLHLLWQSSVCGDGQLDYPYSDVVTPCARRA